MTLVTGDPASMRAAAAQLRLRSETVNAIAARVDTHVSTMTYVGPAADRFRGSIATNSANLRAVSARMINTADTLIRQAAIVEEEQRLQAQSGYYRTCPARIQFRAGPDRISLRLSRPTRTFNGGKEMTQLLWRSPARISVSGPAGWAPAEQVEVHHREGDAVVRVESWPVADGAALTDLAAGHFDASHLPAAQDSGFEQAAVLNDPQGLRRVINWQPESGKARRATLEYAKSDGRMFALTRVVPAADEDRGAEAEAIVASLRVGALTDMNSEQLPLRPQTVDFHDVRDAWLSGGSSAMGRGRHHR